MFLKSLLIFLLAVSTAVAQKFELGKVSLAEIQQKTHPADSNAAAAILFNKAKSYFRYDDKKGFTAKHEYIFRIKIYKKEGLDWANFKVPFYVGYEKLNSDYVKFSDGVTYNIENGTIVKTKLTAEGRFSTDVNEFWNEASITMPNVKVGSVIEFKYILNSENITFFPDFRMQYEIPVNHSEYVTEIPEFFIYKPILTGFRRIKSDSKITYGYQNFPNQFNQTVNLSFQQINSSYIAENVPALKSEPYVDNVSNYRSAVMHELEMTRFPDAPQKNYSMTWDGVANMIFKEPRFGKELNEAAYFAAYLNPVIQNAKTETEKAHLIFAFVRRIMHWDGYYGYLTKKGVKKAFDDKTGNVAEINFILITMLNHAGINANPVLLSTVSNGIPVFPNRTMFNYVIAAADVDGKRLLFDATDKYSAPGILPFRDLNWVGRMVRRDGSSEEIKMVPENLSKQTISVMATIDPSGKINGKTRMVHNDHFAYDFRLKYEGMNRQEYVEKLETRSNPLEIEAYQREKQEDFSQPVTETFNFTAAGETEILDGKLFLRPLLFLNFGGNPFTAEKRELPMFFEFPKQQKFTVNIEIPEGYAIESMPKSAKISTGENVGLFVFNIQNTGNKIQIAAVSEMKNVLVAAAFYDAIKEFYKTMYDKLNEKIILKKI